MESYRDICIYDANSYFLIIGRTKSSKCYKLLKIRKNPDILEIQEVKRSFKKEELSSYVKNLLTDSNKSIIMHAEAILGAVKFLQGFYLFVVAKKSKVATLRGKSVYKIEAAKLIKLYSEKKTKDEKKYIDIFNSLDLLLGFYFSYSYDVTHTLQENIIKDLQTSQPVKTRVRAKTFHSYTGPEDHLNLEQAEIYG